MVFTAPEWNLQQILTELRAITGRPDVNQLTDQAGVDLINWYYQFVMPKELKIFWGYTYYNFYVTPNKDQYPAPVGFQTLNPSVTADGFAIEWYTTPDTFFQDWPEQINKTMVATGNGVLNDFTFQIPAFPVLPRSLYVTDGTQIAQDNGSGAFYDTATGFALAGSINYTTGAVSSLVFPAIPAANVNIQQSSKTYMPNRPQAILFYKTQPLVNAEVATRDNVNMFVVRPVPDNTYHIKMQGIQLPAPMINLTDVPFRPDLGPLIALGAALQLFKRFNQFDQYDQIMPEFLRFKDVCMQDTYEEYLYERSVPAF